MHSREGIVEQPHAPPSAEDLMTVSIFMIVGGMWVGCGWDVSGMWVGCGWDVRGMWVGCE